MFNEKKEQFKNVYLFWYIKELQDYFQFSRCDVHDLLLNIEKLPTNIHEAIRHSCML